jgi:hypothetical protein
MTSASVELVPGFAVSSIYPNYDFMPNTRTGSLCVSLLSLPILVFFFESFAPVGTL